jgi:hypothetical protein
MGNMTTVARCFPDTGNCRFGCTPGWSGSRCDTFNCTVVNCSICVVNQPTVCATCQTGWYLDGGQCTKCSDNCANTNQCDKVSGSCNNGCKMLQFTTVQLNVSHLLPLHPGVHPNRQFPVSGKHLATVVLLTLQLVLQSLHMQWQLCKHQSMRQSVWFL